MVLPLSGPGGKLSVMKHKKGGRQPDGVIPSLMNTANVMDFAFDPFNDHTLAVGEYFFLILYFLFDFFRR